MKWFVIAYAHYKFLLDLSACIESVFLIVNDKFYSVHAGSRTAFAK